MLSIDEMMSEGEYEELYRASVRVPLVLAIFLALWGVVILLLQGLQIDYSSVLSKASGEFPESVTAQWSTSEQRRSQRRQSSCQNCQRVLRVFRSRQSIECGYRESVPR